MSDTAKIIGDRIRTLRSAKGWSQEELAHRADLHPSHMGRLERGEENVTLESLEKVTNALGTTLEELFRVLNKDTENRDTAMLFSIVNKLNKRSTEDQKLFLKLIDDLIQWKDK